MTQIASRKLPSQRTNRHIYKHLHKVCKITHSVSYKITVKLHPVCKITHSMWNYTLCVKLCTICNVCKTTHNVQNFTGVPCAFNMKKIPSLEKIYTPAVTDVTDKYQVWVVLRLSTLTICITITPLSDLCAPSLCRQIILILTDIKHKDMMMS